MMIKLFKMNNKTILKNILMMNIVMIRQINKFKKLMNLMKKFIRCK
jgi:hypothetical protein